MRSHPHRISRPLCVLLLTLLTSCSSDEQADAIAEDQEQQSELTTQPNPQFNQQLQEPTLVINAPTETASSALADVYSGASISEVLTKLQTLEQENTSASALFENRHFEYDTIIQEAGSTPQNLYQWVKTNTSPLPYRGILKGAWGVLIERQGNSIDRSILLVELLHRAGYQAKLSNSILNENTLSMAKEVLLARLDTLPDVIATSDAGWTEEELAKHEATLAGLTGTSPEAARQETTQEAINALAGVSKLIDEANKQTEALIRKLPLDDHLPAPLLEDALASLEDHWWVELANGEETEVFDFFFNQKANSLAELGHAMSDKTDYAREELPDELYHSITFRVIADQLNARGESQSRTAFSHTVRTADSQLEPIKFSFFALIHQLSESQKLSSSIGESRRKLAMQTEWLPALTINGIVFSESVIRADGSLELEPNLNLSSLERRMRQTFVPVEGNHLDAVRLKIDIVGGGFENSMSRTLYDYQEHLIAANSLKKMQQKEIDDAAAAAAAAREEALAAKEKELNAFYDSKEQACAQQAGVEKEKLSVLKGSPPTLSMEEVELITSLYEFEACLALVMDQTYQSRTPDKKASPSPAYRISQDLSNKAPTPDSVFKEGMKVARAANFMTVQRFLVLPINVPEAYVTKQIHSSTVQYQNVIRKLLSDVQPDTPEKLGEELERYDAAKLSLLSYASVRQQPATVGPFAISRANLVSQFRMISFDHAGAKLAEGLDIVSNEILPLTKDAQIGRQTAIRQGVFDTLVENFLIDGGQGSANTAGQFKSDLEKNDAVEWIAKHVNAKNIEFPQTALKEGPESLQTLVYSPMRLSLHPENTSFWLVDIKTGQTLGYTNQGRGGAIGLIITIGAALKKGKTMMAFGQCFIQSAVDQCKVSGCIAKGMGYMLKKSVGGVFGSFLPKSGVDQVLAIFALNPTNSNYLLLRQAGLQVVEKNTKGKVLAEITRNIDYLANSLNRFYCESTLVPSIQSERSRVN